MNLIANAQTMSSREIAELTGKRHSDVIRDITETLKQAEIDERKYASTYTDAMNRSQPEYKLPKRECDLVVSGYSVKYRLAIIDRWQELEAKQAPALPKSFSEALQLAADQAKQLEEQAPKIAVYEQLADRKEDVSTTTLAKMLGTSAVRLNKWLKLKGYKWMGKDLPKAGYESWFNLVCGTNNERGYTQCLITAKGQLEIAKRWAKDFGSTNNE